MVVIMTMVAMPGLRAAEDQKEPAKEAPATLTVRVATVTRQSMTKNLEISGSVAPWEELSVGAEVGGLRIVQVPVEEGQRVRRGQLLVLLNGDVLQAQLLQAQARYKSAQAQVRQTQAGLKQSQARLTESAANYKSAQVLAQRGALSDQDTRARLTTYESAQAQVDQSLQTIASAQSAVTEAQANIAQLQATVARTRILAPDDAWVLKKNAFIGNISDVGAPLFSLARQSRLELNAQVPESDLPQLKLGQQVRVTTDTDPDLKTTGTIRQIGPQINTTTRQALVKVTLSANPRLRPGMFVRAQVMVTKGQALAVPAQAVLMRQNLAQVFVLKGTRVNLRPVKLGDRSNSMVQVLGGLTAGEQIVITGAGYLKDGDIVKVTTLSS